MPAADGKFVFIVHFLLKESHFVISIRRKLFYYKFRWKKIVNTVGGLN